MRRRVLPLLLLATAFPLCAPAEEAAGTTELQRDFAEISGLSPRPEGSRNERLLLELVRSRLDEIGVPWSAFDFRSSDIGHSFSSCLRADLPGSVPDTFIVAVALNDPVDGPPSPSASIALALELLRRTRANRPPVSLEVLFLGAEFGDGPEYPMGSGLFLRDFQPSARTAMAYLDLRQPGGPVRLRTGGRGTVSPPWLVEQSFRALRDSGVPVDLRGGALQVYRLALSDHATLLDPWIEAGVPAIGLEDASGTGGSLEERAAALQELLGGWTAGLPAQWDRHYFLVAFSGKLLVVGELAWVIAVAAFLALLLVWSLVNIRGLKKYVRALGRHVLVLVPVLAVAWALLVAATFALEGLLALRRFPTLWTWEPGLFFLAKLALAAAPLGALARLIRRLPLPRNGNFWSAAALFLLLVDVLVAAGIEISLAAPFLWAFACVFAASLARRRLAKLAWFLPSAAWIAVSLAGAITFPALPVVRLLLFSRLWGNLLLAVMALPFLLFFVRLALVFTGARGRLLLVRLAGAVPPAAAAALAGWLAWWSPFGPDNPRPIDVTQTIDAAAATNRLELVSPLPIGRVEVTDSTGTRQLDLPGPSATVELAPLEALVAVTQESTTMLGRRNILLTISVPRTALRVRAVLEADQDFVLYDCSLPFTRESSRRYQIAIGAFPPDPLAVQITVPDGLPCTLALDIDLGGGLLGARFAAADSRTADRVRLAAKIAVTG